MFGFWIIAPLIVLGIVSIVCASIAASRMHDAKRMLINDQLQSVANEFDGHLVERGWNGMPKLVLNHSGKRFLVSFTKQYNQQATENSCGARHECCYIDVSAECTNPEFRMSVSVHTFTSRINSWFDKERCETGDVDFDQKFLVVANRHNDSIERILNRHVRYELLVGSAFYLRPFKPQPKKVEKKPLPEKRMSGSRKPRSFALKRQPRVRSRYQVPLGTVSMLNKGRISLMIEGGQAEAKLLVHQAEYARLGEILLSVMQAIQEIDRSCSLLNKNQYKVDKPAQQSVFG